jgi:catalase
VATNQRDGQMAYHVDSAPGQNNHINYEPSSLNGLKEAPRTAPDHMPQYNGRLMRESIDRTNNFKQAGERYRLHEDWERDDLINNMVGALATANRTVSDKMVELCTNCDPDWGRRLAEGLEAARAGQTAEGGNQYNEGRGSEAVAEAEEMAHDAKPY